MRVTRAAATRTCAICERTLLMGEHAVRFSPTAATTSTSVRCARTGPRARLGTRGKPDDADRPQRLRRRKLPWAGLFGGQRTAEAPPVAAEPILRRLSEQELDLVEAADLFNASPYRRTVAGIAKSLGEPKVSIVPLSGVSGEMIVSVAWEISWYQYRVTPSRPSRCDSPSAATISTSSSRASRTGTPASLRTAG